MSKIIYNIVMNNIICDILWSMEALIITFWIDLAWCITHEVMIDGF